MLAGTLDRRITLQQPRDVQGPTGDVTQVWDDVAEVWANRRDLSAREYVAAAAVQAEVETVWTIRHRDDVAPRWRVIHGSTTWDITGITASAARRDFLALRCAAPLTEAP